MRKIPVHDLTDAPSDLTDALFDLTDFFWGMDFWGWEWDFGVGSGKLRVMGFGLRVVS